VGAGTDGLEWNLRVLIDQESLRMTKATWTAGNQKPAWTIETHVPFGPAFLQLSDPHLARRKAFALIGVSNHCAGCGTG